jgi:hypothetical protein
MAKLEQVENRFKNKVSKSIKGIYDNSSYPIDLHPREVKSFKSDQYYYDSMGNSTTSVTLTNGVTIHVTQTEEELRNLGF